MAPRPTDVGNFAEALYRQLTPVAYADADAGVDWALLLLCGAIGQMLEQFDELAHSDELDGPWTRLLDVNRIPDAGVPWLGQFAGIEVDTALSVDDQRQQIRELESWQRGTVAAIVRAIQRSGGLTGNKSVIVRERDTSAYHFTILTYPDETVGFLQPEYYQDFYDTYLTYTGLLEGEPSYADMYWAPGELLIWRAIMASKPAGLQFTFSVAYPQDYWSIWEDFATYQIVYDSFGTYQEIYDFNSPAGSGAPGLSEDSVYDMLASYQDVWNELQLYDDLYETYNTY